MKNSSPNILHYNFHNKSGNILNIPRQPGINSEIKAFHRKATQLFLSQLFTSPPGDICIFYFTAFLKKTFQQEDALVAHLVECQLRIIYISTTLI